MENVKDFLDNVWMSHYLERYIQKEDVKEGLRTVVASPRLEVRNSEMEEIVWPIQVEYRKRYDAFLAEIDSACNELRANTKKEFVAARALNNSIQRDITNTYQAQQLKIAIVKTLVAITPGNTVVGRLFETMKSLKEQYKDGK